MTRQPTPTLLADHAPNGQDDVALAMGAQPQRIATVHIRLDGGTQPRTGIDEAVVEDYHQDMRDGAVFPPVELVYDGTDYWLWDGFHRFHAFRQDGDRAIPANVRQGTRRDAVLLSVGANATHGQRRTNADKRRAVLALLNDDEWQQWSDREIARRCAVSQPFVGSVRAELTDNRYQSTERRGADGRTIDTANIGKRPQAPSYATQVELQLAIGDWLDAFDDPDATLNELASNRDGEASILWEDLTANVPRPFRAPDLIIAIAAFRQRMASTRQYIARPAPLGSGLQKLADGKIGQPAHIVQPPNKDDKPAVYNVVAFRNDGVWTFSIGLRATWTSSTPEQKRQTLLQSAAQLETWADQMREEAETA